jgi:hypothetical protein
MSAFNSLENSGTIITALEELAAGNQPDAIDREELQRLIVPIVRLYASKAEASGNFPAAPPGVLTATEVMVVAAALLKAANVNVFELGLWQSWST